MYSNGTNVTSNNKTTTTTLSGNPIFDNSITVTPIKLEVASIPHGAYDVTNSLTVVPNITINNTRRSRNIPPPSSSSSSTTATTTTNPPALATISMSYGNEHNNTTTTESAMATNANLLNPHTHTNNLINASGLSITGTGAIPKDKTSRTPKPQIPRKPPPNIDNFWPNILNDVNSIQHVDAKHQVLPLARIKKIMKLDENAKMIAAEAPLLFAKACEYFIQELTMRAWVYTEESKRRTLQRSDIAQAIANYDQFDFLIDIVPREDIKPTASHKKESASSVHNSTTASPSTSASNLLNTNCGVSSSVVAQGAVARISSPAMQIGAGANATSTLKLDGTTEILSFGAANPDMMTAQQQQLQSFAAHQHQTHPQQQQLQIIQQSAGHPNAQQLQYFIALPGQQPNQTQLIQQLQQTHHHQQQQQHQQQHPQAQHTQLQNGIGLNIVTTTQPPQAQQIILTPTTNQQQTQTLLQTLAAQQQQQQQQQQQLQHQQIQLIQQVVGPNGEITNVPISINANQLNLMRLQMQQQQQQHQQVATQQQVLVPAQMITNQQLLHQLGSHAAATTLAATTAQQQQQQQQQQHSQGVTNPGGVTSTGNHIANTNTSGPSIYMNASPSTQGTQVTHQMNGGNNGNNNNNSNSNVATSTSTNTYRHNC